MIAIIAFIIQYALMVLLLIISQYVSRISGVLAIKNNPKCCGSKMNEVFLKVVLACYKILQEISAEGKHLANCDEFIISRVQHPEKIKCYELGKQQFYRLPVLTKCTGMTYKTGMNDFRGYLFFLKFTVIIIFFTSCAKLDVYRIQYNPDKQVYEYPLPGLSAVTLRTNSGELVTEENFEQFITEMGEMNFSYPFDERMEMANSPRQLDYRLAKMYSKSVHELKEEDYGQAAESIDRLEFVYPEARYYTDLFFLKGYLNEMAGKKSDATQNYKNFLSYSSQKYSDRFREHLYADPNHYYWQKQRAYASDYLQGNTLPDDTDFLREITPKFYFTNLQPGYTLSDEGLVEHSGGIFSISVGTDLSSAFAGGVQYYRNLFDGVDVNPEFELSKNMWEIRMALPIQLYRSGNNRFGVKLSPFGHYSNIKNFITGGEKYNVNEQVFNYGIKASMGFYFVQRLSLGAYYTYNYYNEDRPFSGNSQMPDLWWDNEYDVSLYYPLIKGFNLKAGMKSGDWVAGFYLTGWEISYNINEGKIVLRTEMY